MTSLWEAPELVAGMERAADEFERGEVAPFRHRVSRAVYVVTRCPGCGRDLAINGRTTCRPVPTGPALPVPPEVSAAPAGTRRKPG